MTSLLLDTTFLIAAERGGDSLDELIDDDDDDAIAAITVGELQVGVELADGRRKLARQRFVDTVLSAIPVIDHDVHVAAVHAKLLAATRRQGRPRGAHDLIIAATARAADRVVVAVDAAAFNNLPDVAVRAH